MNMTDAESHLVKDDTGEDEEEHEYVKEHLRALHGTKGGGVPATGILHQVLDRREDVHEDVTAEHGECQQQQRGPPHGGGVSQSFFNCL